MAEIPPTELTNINPYDHLKISRNPDGSLDRAQYPLVPPTGAATDSNSTEPVLTKDITFNTTTKSWLRIYLPTKLPSNDAVVAKLPLILYFHAGGMILYHANTMFNNEPCVRFASEMPCIVLSVDYRLAPENRLPAAYEDARDAILWLKAQASDPANGEEWLANYADFSRCFLMGCSAGANIVYHTALSLPELNVEPALTICGLIMNQPLFGGVKRTRTEKRLALDMAMPLCVLDLMWELALPKGSDRDHEYSNFMVEGKYSKNIGKLPRTLVRGFEGDILLDRQMEFVQMLAKNRVQVTAHFGEFGFHCIDFVDAKSHLMMLKYMRDFM